MQPFKNINHKKMLGALALIIFGSLGRIFLLDLPNVETLTVSALLAGSLLGGLYTVLVPFSIVVLTDFYIGNNLILFFTWSAWIVIGIFGWLLKKKRAPSFKFAGQLTGMGIAASLFFYIYTNFGVWLLWSMYPHTLAGLIQCYIMALPFLKMSLLGNLIIVPLVSGAALLAWKHEQSLEKIFLYFKKITLAFFSIAKKKILGEV